MNYAETIAKIDANIDRIRDQFMPEEWNALGGNDRSAYHCATLERMNAAQIRRDRAWSRSVIAAIAVSACLLALLIATDPMSHFVEHMQTEVAR